MTKNVYIAAPDAATGKSSVALGAIAALTAQGLKVGVFRPIIQTDAPDPTLQTLIETTGSSQTLDQAYGVTYATVRRSTDDAITCIIDRYEQIQSQFDAMVILGSDYSDVIGPIEFSLNARIAANLNAPVLLALSARGETAQDLRHAANFCLREIENRYAQALGVAIVNVAEDALDLAHEALVDLDLPVTMVVPGAITDSAPMPSDFAAAVDAITPQVRTPLRFQYELMRRARSNKRTIVLPETEDDRILKAADRLLARDIVNLILLGDASAITARAEELGLDLSRAKVQDPTDAELVEKFAQEYTKLRSHKGMTVEKARQTLTDLSYVATMMIHFGMADGMVSGAIHTTANTIRPSLEFIKTKPGVALVSGYFLMCLPDRVFVFADCAVTTNPTPEQLSDIALASAQTAQAFDIEPRVALLSYSTGDSGTGPDVDMVREATMLLHARAPHLPAEGPIQFDAAIDPVVAQTKLPGSSVAGHATVFVFPDLDTGNITYKAVQRTAHTLALGPVLQGLRKPVNDLSRGALVDDIINTVAITAIQAQDDPGVDF
ncbi:MAG: phosphate acetyltransferase [Propionibacteriaceae bacterium]|jgi:phosphate acetyltransferase|nr:phosphate acetyltransferase [Propionibacteriaceae bacterium]